MLVKFGTAPVFPYFNSEGELTEVRSPEPLIVDGEATETFDKRGTAHRVKLNEDQRTAFAEILADATALSAVLEAGEFTLPDAGTKGRRVKFDASGSLAAILASATAETPEDGPSSDGDSPEPETEPETPATSRKRS